ncbi:hypothetical protein VN97_g216 [Penicillium thymicola]|uniref:Uncharacterized protein n=1 Tax=Penicillium thymicola TaxID=293382 RepID=A0AAI9TT69_PENTH|nr:hypothetical protein VN97_g216 [Penicillium thymicola]
MNLSQTSIYYCEHPGLNYCTQHIKHLHQRVGQKWDSDFGAPSHEPPLPTDPRLKIRAKILFGFWHSEAQVSESSPRINGSKYQFATRSR